MSLDFTPPPGIDLSESRQPQLYAAFISTFCLSVVAVGLRLICRLGHLRPGLWWDDYMICASLLMTAGNFVAMIIWIPRGLGKHIYPYGLKGFGDFFLNLFVIEILYTLSICFTKYSILLFYWRIFNATSIRIPIYLITGLVTGWGIGVIGTTIFQCLPIQGFWDKTIPAVCGVDVNSFFIGNAVPNIVTDWALLLLPLPYIWRLHRNTVQKLAIYATFLLGGFICIISIIRLTIMLDAYKVPSIDVTWVFIGPSTWTAVETNIGVVSACLPSLRPLLRHFGGSTEPKPSYNNREGPGFSGGSGYSYGSAWAKKSPYPRNGTDNTTTTEGYSSDQNLTEINVRTSVDVRGEEIMSGNAGYNLTAYNNARP
ncbi:integral membrane protein [Trichophyton tonsurans CBS 112818]|uniref:Integral membrane protein n=2 Tax=Trichophyton TaxID=5550 RepID=F2PMX2_TRIEC|nr:integral membrane protein [Trichophyton tonsurans CBS 112818]EGE03240.1 integral membrane protein [Trichophyton equinum CBS 127.97]